MEAYYALALGNFDWTRDRSSGEAPNAGERSWRFHCDDSTGHCRINSRDLARSPDRLVSAGGIGRLSDVGSRGRPVARYLSSRKRAYTNNLITELLPFRSHSTGK